MFHLGDLVQHARFGVGEVVERDDSDETLYVRFDRGEWWVDEGDCASEMRLEFRLAEDVNYDERVAWLRQLIPIYGAYDYCVCSLLQSAYVGRVPVWQDDPFALVDPATLTVEAEGEGSLRYDPRAIWDLRSRMYGQVDLAPTHDPRLTLIVHGATSHVASFEVTL